MEKTYLGIDIGGTKCAVCLGTDSGKILGKIQFPTADPTSTVQRLLDEAKNMVEKAGVKITAIGISCGSPLDPDKGIIQEPPNLPGWKDVQVVKIFKDAFGAPAFLDNDANAGALAEYEFGAGRGFKNVIFITFGTGCGSGLILDGRIYRGTNCNAGEIGHMRLAPDGPVGYHKKGSMEGFCSGGGIAQIAAVERAKFKGKTSLPEKPNAKDVGDAADQGDELAIKIMDISAEKLGHGLAILIDLFNPERIIIGSIFSRSERHFRKEMDRILSEEALPQSLSVCKIVPSGLGNSIGDYAAISIARYSMSQLA